MTRPRNLGDILAQPPDAKKCGDGWTASCPAPGHRTPQKHLSLEDAGDKALVTCHGGRHGYADICQALGFDSLTYSDNSREEVGAVHVLRHSGAIERLRVSGNPKSVQEQLRHSSALMTLRYLKTVGHDEAMATQQRVDVWRE